jgi:hypothetical protein
MRRTFHLSLCVILLASRTLFMNLSPRILSLFAAFMVCAVSAADLQLSIATLKDQEHAAVTQLTNGMIVFAWEDEATGISEIWFRRYDSNLNTIGTAIRAHNAMMTDQAEPVIAPLTNGFVLAWAARGFDGSDYGIAYRRFDTNGTALDAAVLQANTTTAGAQLHPDIAPLTGGGFVIVWDDESGAYASLADQDVRYRRFFSTGAAMDPVDLVANAWGIDARIAGNQGNPRVATMTNGGFVVVYEDRESENVFAVRFDSSGNPLQVPSLPASSRQHPVNLVLSNAQWAPAVSSFTNGAFVVVFNSDTDGTAAGRRVIARVFHPGGIGSNEMVLGSFTNRTQDARVATLSNGNFVVTMQSLGVGPDTGSNWWSVLAQRGRTNNALLGPSFIANSYHTNDQDRPAIAALRDGSYVLAWQSYGQDTDRYGIYAQRFTAAGEPSGGRLEVSRMAPTGTNFFLRLTNGTPYVQYRLQATTNFTNWATLLTTNTPNGVFQYTETQGGVSPRRRMYRAVTP